MDKEMKKLLLVAVSVGVFLLVTITAAIVISTAKMQGDAISSSVPYSNNMNDLPPVPAVISKPQEPIVNYENTEVTEAPIESDKKDKIDGNNVIISIATPSAAAVPNNPTVSESTSVAVAEKPAQKPVEKSVSVAAEKSTATTKPTSTTAANSAATSKPAAAAKPATTAKSATTKASNDYWVQTGAFSSMVRAEDAKELLFNKGLTSIIETSIVNGQNFFRVRLGPYTSENEAKHWLAIVQLIDGFHDSQVRQTVR